MDGGTMAYSHRDLELMLRDYRLTTAEILYHLPDHPALLQSYVWQEFDLAPKFPSLKKFLAFWERELDGKIHSVNVMHAQIIAAHEFRFQNGPIQMH
jgi:uncharacterized protein Usg